MHGETLTDPSIQILWTLLSLLMIYLFYMFMVIFHGHVEAASNTSADRGQEWSWLDTADRCCVWSL